MKFKPNRFLNVRFLYAGFYCNHSNLVDLPKLTLTTETEM